MLVISTKNIAHWHSNKYDSITDDCSIESESIRISYKYKFNEFEFSNFFENFDVLTSI